MAHIIAVANLKGGCGKSCIAVNLACELASKRSTVTLVDADVQATSSHYCSSGNMPARCEHLPLEDAREVDRWLRRVLTIDTNYVVLDAPPHIGTTTKAIVAISNLVLVPCTPSTADLFATIPAVELIRNAQAANKNGAPRCLLVPSRVDSRTTPGREIEQALKKLGEPVGPAVHQRTAFVDAFTAGQWIGEYSPASDAHADITALAEKVRRIIASGEN